MQSTSPLVSVIVCVYNAGEYLRPSLVSLLAQTYRNLEILVLDDGSTDGCMETIADVRDDRMQIFRQENHGKPATMNRALGMMKGEFYAVHDADDLSHPQRIELQLAALLSHPNVAAAYCGHELILDGKRVAPTGRFKDIAACKQDIDDFRMPGHDPTGMYRWSLVRDYRYDPTLFLGEGFDYILRIGEQHPMIAVGECLYTYRIHRESITKRNPELREKLVHEVLKRTCARRGIDYTERFPESESRRKRQNRDFDNNLAAHFMDSVCDLRRCGAISASLLTGLECIRLHPLDLHYHKAFLYAISPRWLIRRVRRNGYSP
jgi:glycosyltransferase involved in cell wall biosynthesis